MHDQAAAAQDTDWREILGLYELLERMTHNPMVTLNRAIAAAMVDGPVVGLALLVPLSFNRRCSAAGGAHLAVGTLALSARRGVAWHVRGHASSGCESEGAG